MALRRTSSEREPNRFDVRKTLQQTGQLPTQQQFTQPTQINPIEGQTNLPQIPLAPLATGPLAPPSQLPTSGITPVQEPIPQSNFIQPPAVPIAGQVPTSSTFGPSLQAPSGEVQQVTTNGVLPQPNVLSGQSTQAAPQTGLIGAEQALQAGLGAGIESLTQGAQQARTDIGSGQQAIGGLVGQAQGQLGTAQQNIQGQVGQGLGALGQAQTQGLGQINRTIGQAAQPLQGFIDPGQQAQQRQAALSGALGADAQAQAFQEFQASPGQEFIQERERRGLLRSAGAIGGLGGGRVREALNAQQAGFAQQDLQNEFNRLGSVTGTGLTAAGQVGQLRGQQAALGSGLIGQLSGQGTGLRSTGISAGTNLTGVGANLAGQQITSADRASNALANISQATGQGVSGLFGQTGTNIATGRTQAGRDIAQAVGGTTSALSNLASQQGAGLADIVGQGGANISNLLQNFGNLNAGDQQQLAILLANLSTGQGTQLAGLQGEIGAGQAAGITGSAAGLRRGAAQVGQLLI